MPPATSVTRPPDAGSGTGRLTRAQVYRRRRLAVFGGGSLALVVLLYLPFTLLAPLGSAQAVVRSSTVAAGQAAAPVLPAYGGTAVSAIGWDGLLVKGGDQGARPIASVTKMITALVVLDAKPLKPGEAGPTITMTSADVQYYQDAVRQNGTVAVARAGIRYTERDMLTVTLVKSANNYATSMAVWAYGSLERFLAAAKSWTAARGLTGTVLADASGLDPGSRSSPADLVAVGKLAMADPVLADIVDEQSFQVHDAGLIENTNKLLGSSGVVGIKTGTLQGYGANLLFASRFRVGDRSVTIVGAVLGGADQQQVRADVRALIRSVKAGFRDLRLASKGAALVDYSTRWGQRVRGVAARDASALVWSDTPVSLKVDATPTGLSAAGTRVGTATYTAGATVVTVPIVLSAAITDPGPGWRLTHPFSTG
ncbi:MAG: D-alanyl-D-alanine carboxypeptidase [Micrococcales bacterium]|nr:D-alanyl-D-alanine carboxypeptidase [Micrococcales bacterium]